MASVGSDMEYSRYHYQRALVAAHWDGRHGDDTTGYWRWDAKCPKCDPTGTTELLVLPWKNN